jgi:hypothetical protein
VVEIIKNNKIVTLLDGDVHLSFKMRQSVAEIISHSENISDLIPLFDLFVKKYSPLSVRIYLTSDSHLPKEEDLFIHHLGFKRTHSGHRKDKRWVSNEWPRSDSFEESYSCTYTRRKNKEEFRSLVEEHGFESHIEMMNYLGYHQEVVFDGYRILDEWVNEGDFLGYLYRMECSCGKFYVGMSKRVGIKEIESYHGGGTRWRRHVKAHKDHVQSKEIVKWCRSYNDLVQKEILLINESKESPLCMNLSTRSQSNYYGVFGGCAECGSRGPHKKLCSLYVERICQFCGVNGNSHRSTCPKHVKQEPCSECGSTNHKKTCSKYKGLFGRLNCEECGSTSTRHKKTCSQYKRQPGCKYCGSEAAHRKGCIKYTKRLACKECGLKSYHKEYCSHYKPKKTCSECGSSVHRKTCSHYIKPKPCPECGNLTTHKSGCSKPPKV